MSSACVEHLDFLSPEETRGLEGAAVSRSVHLHSTARLQVQQLGAMYQGYNSLTDIPKAVQVEEEHVDFAAIYKVGRIGIDDAEQRVTPSLVGSGDVGYRGGDPGQRAPAGGHSAVRHSDG